MRKPILISILILCCTSLFSEDKWNPFIHEFDLHIGPDSLLYVRDVIYFCTFLFEDNGVYEVIEEDKISLNQNGYHYCDFFGNKAIIIYGGRNNFIFFDPYKKIGLETYVLTSSIPIVKTASSSSFLTETIRGSEVDYSPRNLIRSTIEDVYLGSRHWNIANNLVSGYQDSYPWVEGVDGNGVSEWLNIEFIEPSDKFAILNGYVDPRKPHLYKQNNRVKTMRIESLDLVDNFIIEVDLKDVVEFQVIELPEVTGNIKITISTVFNGSKYNDTAITGLFTVDEEKSVYSDNDRTISLDEMIGLYQQYKAAP